VLEFGSSFDAGVFENIHCLDRAAQVVQGQLPLHFYSTILLVLHFRGNVASRGMEKVQ
jgi:hypothetical protein